LWEEKILKKREKIWLMPRKDCLNSSAGGAEKEINTLRQVIRGTMEEITELEGGRGG
jgi:hypothetical protein